MSLFGQPARDERQHLALALGEPVERRAAARASAAPGLRAGSSGASPRAAARTAAVELVRLGVLQQVADRAGVERARGSARDRRTTSARRPPRPGWVAAIARRRLDAVEHRHLEVHQDDVGLGLAAELDRLLAVRRRADELDVLERRDEALEARCARRRGRPR